MGEGKQKLYCADCIYHDWEAYYDEIDDDWYEYAFCELDKYEFDYNNGSCEKLKPYYNTKGAD